MAGMVPTYPPPQCTPVVAPLLAAVLALSGGAMRTPTLSAAGGIGSTGRAVLATTLGLVALLPAGAAADCSSSWPSGEDLEEVCSDCSRVYRFKDTYGGDSCDR